MTVQRAPLAADQPEPRPGSLAHRAVTTPFARRSDAADPTTWSAPRTSLAYEASADLTGLLARSADRLAVTAALISKVARTWRTAGLDDAAKVVAVSLSTSGTLHRVVDAVADLSADGVRSALSDPSASRARVPATLTVMDLTATRLDGAPPPPASAHGWVVTVGSAPLQPHLRLDEYGQPRLANRRCARVRVTAPDDGNRVGPVECADAVEALIRLLEEAP